MIVEQPKLWKGLPCTAAKLNLTSLSLVPARGFGKADCNVPRNSQLTGKAWGKELLRSSAAAGFPAVIPARLSFSLQIPDS